MTTGESITLEIQFDLMVELVPRVKLAKKQITLHKRREERSLNNNSFLGEYEYSSLALDKEEKRDEKKRLDHLKQNQTMLVIKRFSERKKVFRERKKTGKIRAKRLIRGKDKNTCNNDKNLSKIQLEHEREDEMVVVVHECRMVVKETEDVLLEEMEVSHFGKEWFEQDIDGENEDDNKNKLVMEIEKWLNEKEIHQQESLVTESTTLEANLSTNGTTSDDSSVTEGIALDANRGKEEHDFVYYEQQRTLFASLINNLKCDVEKCNEVNREAQQANALLTNELERYKEKEKHFAKEKSIESEYCKKIKLLNDEILNLKSQACEKGKTFIAENEKFDE
ncbi:hypothetical protein Tco_0528425 [Tanacetum coccineum]